MKSKYKPGSLGATWHELKSGSWLAKASARGSRRKSRWNLLLFLVAPVFIVLLIESLRAARLCAMWLLHGRTIPINLIWPAAIAPIFVYPLLAISTLLAAMVLTNYAIYYLVPPARRAMAAEDKQFPGVDYATQQPILVGLTVITYPVAFILAVAGEIFL
jgi:hypothetical protein